MNYKEELQKIYSTPKPEYSNAFLNKEIVLYGAGSLGHMAINLLLKAGIRPKYIVDKFVKGDINGINIINPEQISKHDKENFLFLVCIATVPYNDIIEYLNSLDIKNTLQFYTYAYIKFPSLLLNGWTEYEITDEKKEKILLVCNMLKHDQQSLSHYLQFLWWKVRGIEHLYEQYPVLSGKKYFGSPSLPSLTEDDILLDGGCHYGQTIDSFINATNNKYTKIYAFEPDPENLKICVNKFNDERIIYSDNPIYNECKNTNFLNGLGYASKIDENGNSNINTITIDSLNINPTIIKLHIEGDELKGLEGAEATIRKHKPILMIMADHSPESLYKIPEFISKFDGYKLFFNLHDYCGNSAVYYAIPKKRLI